MWGSVLSVNVSAQSPPCSRNASPLATSASCSLQPDDLGGHRHRRHALQHLTHRRGLVGGPAGLLGGWLGQRGVQPGPQVGRQRRQRRQLVDRYVDGPVHRSIVTGAHRRLYQRDRRQRSGANARLPGPSRAGDEPEPAQLIAGVDQGVVGVARPRRHPGRPAVLPQLPQFAGKAGYRRAAARSSGPTADTARRGRRPPPTPTARSDRRLRDAATRTSPGRRGSAGATATAATPAAEAWAAHWRAPSGRLARGRIPWTRRSTRGRPRPRRRSRSIRWCGRLR